MHPLQLIANISWITSIGRRQHARPRLWRRFPCAK